MQIDRWTIGADAEQSDVENNVNFSVWIDPVGQHMSSSYFTQEKAPRERMHPVTPTPIPPRASAQAPGSVQVRPRYPRSSPLSQESDITRTPTVPQPILWQYDSAEYQAESSLSSLSLVVPEMASKDKERRYVTPNPHPAIEDIKTVPPAKKEKRHQQRQKKSQQLRIPKGISELDDIAPNAPTVSVPLPGGNRAVPAVRPPAPAVESDSRSWTVGSGANSAYAKRIISDDRHTNHTTHTARLNPLDQMRWWLLYPGRIEFLLWFTGTITLMTVTCIFLFVTVVSFGWISPGGTVQVGSTTSAVTTSTAGSVPCAAQGEPCTNGQGPGKTQMLFFPLTQGPLIAGMAINMQGQGFTPRGVVAFTHDSGLPCQPASQSADAHGTFIVAIQLGVGAQWKAGGHEIVAYDTVSKHLITANILIVPGDFGKSATPVGTTTPGTPAPGVTPTAGTGGGNGGGQPNPLPTPVGRYPVTPTPVAASPTPVPTQSVPTPTPTAITQPTPTQPPKPAPTPTVSITPTAGNTNIVPSQVMSLKASAAHYTARLSSGVWLWLVLIGYALSMIMLGVAGVLHRRNHAQRTRS